MDVRRDGLGPRVERSAVLVSTGSFSPIHRGHLAMMDAARRAVEERGWNVRGGYLSPSHDHYVSGKYGGDAAMTAERRIALVEAALVDRPWLSVDGWEAAHPTSVGHYRVIARLEAADLADRVYYVCGGDRAGFVGSSVRHGHCCVCVARDGGEAREHYRRFVDDDRILFAEATEYAGVSSTAVRAGARDGLPHDLAALYERALASRILDSR